MNAAPNLNPTHINTAHLYSVQDYIKVNGQLNIQEALELALYHPTFGYYKQSGVIGSQHDFLTAPEISQLFGEMLAFWCIAKWTAAGKPDAIHLIELGPGRGTLMRDMLQILIKQPEFMQSLTVSLVDISPHLALQQQQQLLAHNYIYWYEKLDMVPIGADFTLIIANEFFDALPIKQFVNDQERFIKYSDAEQCLVFGPPSNPKTVREHSPLAIQYLNLINSQLSPGCALIIDYGDDTAPEHRRGDTLQAIYKHKPIQVLESLGFADISHQVDFYTLRQMAGTHHFYTQSQFLLAMGLEKRLEKLIKIASPSQRFNLSAGAARLVSPSEMGHIFKVLEIIKINQ